METDVVIVGAGLAGLTAARGLVAAGRSVVLFDKGRRAGGRCATKTVGGATLDTGAQFFTVRSRVFADLVAGWTAEGCPIRVWSDGFARAQTIADPPESAQARADGHPRYSVRGGMNRLAAHLARDLDVRTSTRVIGIRPGAGGWHVEGPDMQAAAVVLTPPLPQTLALLGNGGVEQPAQLRDQDYEPCLALLLALDRAPRLPAPGGVQFAGGPIAWLGDSVAKGAGSAPAVTVHASASWSETFFDAAPEVVTEALLAMVTPWLAGARPMATVVFRWRYSKPRRPADVGALLLGPGLVVAGDALAGSRVEGAVSAGLASQRLLEQ